MGPNDRAQNRKDDKERAKQEARRRRQTFSSSTSPADWATVDGLLLAKAVAALARIGGALRLGYTRDGGAYAIGFYGDGEPFTEYVSPNDDIELFLKGVIDDYGKE